MRGRRLIVPGTAAALVLTALIGGQSADAAPRGAQCQLAGSASISPGLTTAAKIQKVTLSGVKLTGCHVGNAGAPGVPKTVTGTVTTSPNPVTSKASCASGNLALAATIRWSTGGTTSANIKTTGLTASQTLNGKVSSSTDPNLKPGDIVAGEVAFKPTTTAQNCAKVPVTKVTFTGALAAGSPN
jgi:hypothetical protein